MSSQLAVAVVVAELDRVAEAAVVQFFKVGLLRQLLSLLEQAMVTLKLAIWLLPQVEAVALPELLAQAAVVLVLVVLVAVLYLLKRRNFLSNSVRRFWR